MTLTELGPQKLSQAQHFDGIEHPEFEINRPHGESRLYQYLMDYKMRRVLSLLGRPIAGARVLVICCGSGMDAEYLVREGATVMASDISAGCLERARERMRRHALHFELDAGDLRGLRLFYRLAAEDGLIERARAIDFTPAP